MAAGNNTKVILLAFIANMGIALAKFVGAFITQSASMFSEAIHSVVDSTNQLILLWGAKASKRAPDARHPLGYGKEAFFWSFIVAIMLFTLGGVFAIYEGMHKLKEPGELKAPFVALGILFVAIVLEGISFRACLVEVRKQNRYGSLWAWVRKTSATELVVVFLEDLGALLGLFVALLALLTAWLTGDSRWDALGSVFVGCLLVGIAIVLSVEIKSLLIGEAPDTDYESKALATFREVFPDAKILHLIALQTGGDEVLLSLKFNPCSHTSSDELIHGINKVEKTFKSRYPEVNWLFVEPDLED